MNTLADSGFRKVIDGLAGKPVKQTSLSGKMKVILFEKLMGSNTHELKCKLVFEDRSEVICFNDGHNKPAVSQRIHLDWTDEYLSAIIRENSIELHGSPKQIEKFNTVVCY